MRSSKSRSRNKNRNRPQGGGNIVNRVFDSSGPEGKVRGTPAQIIEKYNQLARDAQLSSDRVALENFQQHSEHYTRMLAAAQKELDARQNQGGGQQPQEDRQGIHGGGHGNQGGQGGSGNQGGQHQQDRRGGEADTSAGRDGGQPEAGEPSPREGQGGRRGGRRRERGEDRASQGGASEVIEPVEVETGPVPTPEGEQDAARTERPKRARTRRKAPAPTDGEEDGAAASSAIDDSAA